MNLGYYPGCSLTGTAKEYDASLREVLSYFGIQFNEINDWSCCGATSAHATNYLLSIALPARNLLLAKHQGMEEIFAPCAACFNRLISSKHELEINKNIKLKVEDLYTDKFDSSPEVINVVQLFLQHIGLKEISTKKKIDLSNLKIACYYGCLLLRPRQILEFDDNEDPQMMEEIITAAGAKAVKWDFKTECCGASHTIANTEIVENLSRKIIENAAVNKADLIVVACPMCHSNLDMRQKNILKHNPGHKEIPVLYLTQLVGLAIGIDYSRLGLNLHFINPLPLLNSKLKKEVGT
jgi:heterodisulfide reductase subunit B